MAIEVPIPYSDEERIHISTPFPEIETDHEEPVAISATPPADETGTISLNPGDYKRAGIAMTAVLLGSYAVYELGHQLMVSLQLPH